MIDQVSKQPQLPKRRAAPPPGRGPFLSPILGRKVCIPILSGLFAINSDRRRAPDPRVVRGNRDWVSDPLKCESHTGPQWPARGWPQRSGRFLVGQGTSIWLCRVRPGRAAMTREPGGPV